MKHSIWENKSLPTSPVGPGDYLVCINWSESLNRHGNPPLKIGTVYTVEKAGMGYVEGTPIGWSVSLKEIPGNFGYGLAHFDPFMP